MTLAPPIVQDDLVAGVFRIAPIPPAGRPDALDLIAEALDADDATLTPVCRSLQQLPSRGSGG